MKDIDTLITEYYRGQQLSDACLNAMLRQAARQRPRRHGYWAAAAMVLLVSLAMLQWQLTADPASRVLSEVVRHHRQNQPMTVVSADYEDVQAALERLNFPLDPPPAICTAYQLLGGRFCTIQGNPAAQLKLRNKTTGKVKTLFVTDLTPHLAAVDAMETEHDGVNIRLWQENQIFFALVES